MPILSEEDLERFRTKVCTLASSMRCDFGVERCNYSHNLYWARRCPFYLRDSSILRYIPACCPDVELGPGSAVLRNTCPRGNNCSFAHSLEEMHYHPLVYKTELCKEYRVGRCKTYYCHMVHGLAEFRVPRDFVLPRKRGLQIPAYAHVTMVDNIRSIQGGASSCGHVKDKLRGRSERESPKSIQTTLQQSHRMELPKGRHERILFESAANTSQFNKDKSETADSRLGSICWGQESSACASGKFNHSNSFNGFRIEEVPNSSSSHIKCDYSKKNEEYGASSKLISRIGELSISDTESTTPWYGKGVDIPEMGAYNFSSFDTIFQESLKSIRPSSETATGECLSKLNSLANTEDILASSAKVVRNVGGWKATAPAAREICRRHPGEEGKTAELVAGKESNAGLMEYIYHTIRQQSAAITERCAPSNDNRSNLDAICKEAHSLWQLIVNIQALLFDGTPGETVVEGQRDNEDRFEGQWSSLGSFYSELIEAYESESGKTNISSVTARGETAPTLQHKTTPEKQGKRSPA